MSSTSKDDGMFGEALATFFAEARDMLQQIEDALLILEVDPNNQDTLNALFRAAHTIKGSSGLFGLDRIVRFTHQVESVLDRVRNSELIIDMNLSDVLLKSADVIASLLMQSEHKIDAPDEVAALDRDATVITAKLLKYMDQKPGGNDCETARQDVAAPEDQAMSDSHSDSNSDAHSSSEKAATWHISVRFGQNTFRNGFDPLSVVHYLHSLGELAHVLVIVDNLPPFEEFDPESCYLGFELRLHTTASKADIESAFEFVKEDCTVRMLPPARRTADFIALMNELPHEGRLGDLLVGCGAVTRVALDEALSVQQSGVEQQEGRSPQPLGEILIRRGQVSPEVLDAALVKQRRTDVHSEESRFVRVPADKLDDLINLVGELVICGASATLFARNVGEPKLIEITQQMSNLVEEIRNGTLGLRMVQIGESFARFRRVVRDTATELGKEIRLDIEGAETELDKAVIEKISDPLMHLVRNAIDHGIESTTERIQVGKPPVGTLCLSANHDSGNIVIHVTDDGRGLNSEKIFAKARERGLVAANQTLTEAEKLNLIFLPGFSTAEKITNLSGRGVGMDVVKKNIEALRGSVVLKSVVGKGTAVEIRLPLTLAIIDGFLVKLGHSSYVIPLHAVVECIDADQDRLRTNGDWAGYLDLRGEVLPFLELRRVFDIQEPTPSRRSIVVVRNGESMAGLVVDQLLGEYQTVIKPLGKLFKTLRGISGSTVMGSGEVALILDVPALVELATEREDNDDLYSNMAGEVVVE